MFGNARFCDVAISLGLSYHRILRIMTPWLMTKFLFVLYTWGNSRQVD